jgi:hypothetical protein
MKITDVKIERFRYRTKSTSDSEGHQHPGQEHDATQTLVTIITEKGFQGYCFGVQTDIITFIFLKNQGLAWTLISTTSKQIVYESIGVAV